MLDTQVETVKSTVLSAAAILAKIMASAAKYHHPHRRGIYATVSLDTVAKLALKISMIVLPIRARTAQFVLMQ
eukprot:COSAG02_NODE_19438_length_882_cov_0.950192_2_plen_73_part_00